MNDLLLESIPNKTDIIHCNLTLISIQIEDGILPMYATKHINVKKLIKAFLFLCLL